jgi:hypothetical protein
MRFHKRIVLAVFLALVLMSCESGQAQAALAVLSDAWPSNVEVIHQGADRETRFYVGVVASVDDFVPQPHGATVTDESAFYNEDYERVIGLHYLASWRTVEDGMECYVTSYQVIDDALWRVYTDDESVVDALGSGATSMVELSASCGGG